MIKPADRKLIIDFEELVDVIKSSTSVNPFESSGDKRKRISHLLSDYPAFCAYYFPEYCFAPFAWFHKEHFPFIARNPNDIYLLQYAREFAKSTHGGLFMPMFLKFNNQLNGMIVGSHDENMAAQKLMDIQANLENNQRIINDFGEQMSWGDWESGQFKTRDDIAFYGFGKRQSPRGYKFKWRRPNYGLVDDLNDSRQLKNDDIALEDKRWVMEELKPALWIKNWWLVIAQNKFHDNTVTALIESDEDLRKTVFRVNMEDEKGNCNWPENFTKEEMKLLKESEGGAFIRERQNTPYEEGTIFQAEHLGWIDPLPLDKYDGVLVHYLDPSYKATEKSDFKAWILLGKTGLYYHILKSWIERTSSKSMWEYAFMVDDDVGELNTIKHAMEANFIQEDIHGKELQRVEFDKGRALRVSMDHRNKPDKFQRIETLQPLFQRGLIKFNRKEQHSPGMKLLRKQLLAFEKGSRINDDGPDALEGAIWFIDRHGSRQSRKPRSGKFNVNKNRQI
jgi:predicted phage terminase large subunit-like protein